MIQIIWANHLIYKEISAPEMNSNIMHLYLYFISSPFNYTNSAYLSAIVFKSPHQTNLYNAFDLSSVYKTQTHGQRSNLRSLILKPVLKECSQRSDKLQPIVLYKFPKNGSNPYVSMQSVKVLKLYKDVDLWLNRFLLKVMTLFKKALKSSPCIIYLDKCFKYRAPNY